MDRPAGIAAAVAVAIVALKGGKLEVRPLQASF
jgi:hypothetical protein